MYQAQKIEQVVRTGKEAPYLYPKRNQIFLVI